MKTNKIYNCSQNPFNIQLVLGQILIDELFIQLYKNFQKYCIIDIGEGLDYSFIRISTLEIDDNVSVQNDLKLFYIHTIFYLSGLDNIIILEKLKAGAINGFEFGFAILAFNTIKHLSIFDIKEHNIDKYYKKAILMIDTLSYTRKVVVEISRTKFFISQQKFLFGIILINCVADFSLLNSSIFIPSNFGSPLCYYNLSTAENSIITDSTLVIFSSVSIVSPWEDNSVSFNEDSSEEQSRGLFILSGKKTSLFYEKISRKLSNH